MNASKTTFGSVVDALGKIVNTVLVPLLFAFALMYFLYGVLKFIKAAENEDERKKGRTAIFAGLIGLAVMVSVWGLVQIVAGTIGQSVVIPQIDVKNLKQ